jgi:hypothetical protein
MFPERKVAEDAVRRPVGNALRSPRGAFLMVGLALLVVLSAGACGRSQSAVTETKDDYRITFATNPAAPGQGEGTVVVSIKDKQGQPVDGAQVSIEANMSHAGMTPVSASSASSTGGQYRLPINWTMGGSWYVDVKMTLQNGEVLRRRFPVDVK